MLSYAVPIRTLISEADIPTDFITAADSPLAPLLDKLFFTDYSVITRPDGIGLMIELVVAGEASIGLPGLNGFAIVFGNSEGGATLINASFSLFKGAFSAELDDVTIALRFPPSILKPVAESPDATAPPYAQVEIHGTVSLDENFDLHLEGFDSLSLKPVMIGNSGIIISAEEVKLDFSRTATLPEIADAGFDESFIGVYIGEATVKLPEGFPALAPEDLVLRNCAIGSGGVSGKLEANYSPTYKKENKTFTGRGAGDLFGIPFGLKRMALELKQNAFQEAEIVGELLLPFFDEPVEVEIGIDIDGGLSVRLVSAGPNGLYKLTKENILELELDSIAFDVKDALFTAKLSGVITPLLGKDRGLNWPSFDVREMSIDSSGNVNFAGGWVDLPKSYALDFHGAKVEITKFGMGSTDDGGRYIGLSGHVELVKNAPAGASVEGLRIVWYDDGRAPRLSFNGIGLKFSVPNAIEFDGKVSYSEAGGQPRFIGDVKVYLPTLSKLKLLGKAVFGTNTDASGKVSKYFAVYIEGDFGKGIPLWAADLWLYGISGIFAINYAPDKPPEMAWYSIDKSKSWFHKPQKGVTDILHKWKPQAGTLAVGAGITVGTGDGGHKFSGKFILLLLFPGPVFMIEGRAAFLGKRSDLAEDAEPPFHALIVLDTRAGYFLIGLDAQWKYDKSQGGLIDLRGSAEAYFSFQDPNAWYFKLGNQDPIEQRIQATLARMFTANSYFMLDPKQLRLGAWIGKEDSFRWGPVSGEARLSLDANAVVSFKPAHFHTAMQLDGYLGVKVFKFNFGFGLYALLSVDIREPFHILGVINITIETKWKDFDIELRLEWGPRTVAPDLSLPELKPILNWGVAHPKTSLEWPLEHGGTPKVPVDCRPYVTFGYPIDDEIKVGVNAGPDPGWMIIGDPSSGQGAARVRYRLTKISLFKEGKLIAARPKPAGQPELGDIYGSWAPSAVSGTSGSGVGGQTRLLLYSKNPLEHTDNTASWNPWLASNLQNYPCPPSGVETICMDFLQYSPGKNLQGPWRSSQPPDFVISWADGRSHPIVPVSPAVQQKDRGLFFPAPVARKRCKVYVSNAADNTVSVLNLESRQLLTTLPVGSNPRQIVLSRDGSLALVCNQDVATANQFNTATDTIGGPDIAPLISSVSIAITPDRKWAFAANATTPGLSVIDLIIDQVQGEVHINPARYVVISPDGTKLYVTHGEAGGVSIISVASRAVIKSLPAPTGAHSLVIHPNLPRAWFTFPGRGVVRLFDTDRDEFTALETPTGSWPLDLAISPDGSRLFVANMQGNTVSVLDSFTLDVLATIPVPAGPLGLAVTPDGSSLLVGNSSDNTLAIIDPFKNQVVAKGFPASGGPSVASPVNASQQLTSRKRMGHSIAVLDVGRTQFTPLPPVLFEVFIDVPRGSSSVSVTWSGKGPLRASVSNQPAAHQVVAANGQILTLTATAFGLGAKGIDQIRLTGESEWTLISVCVNKPVVEGGLGELSQVLDAMNQHVAVWYEPAFVFEPEKNYKAVVEVSGEAEGLGELEGWSTTLSDSREISFCTVLPPGLGNVDSRSNQATGLEDLALYVEHTIPFTQAAKNQLPVLTKPVFCGYDVTIVFNNNYVDQMYQAAGRDLDLILFDRNNLPVRSVSGRLIIVEDPWENSPELKLIQSEAQWIEMFNSATCVASTIDPKLIPTNKMLASREAWVLEADTPYEARLVPRLVRQPDLSATRWTAQAGANGAALRMLMPTPGSDAWTDYRVSVLVAINSADVIGIPFRYLGSNYYEFTIDPGANKRRLTLVQGSTTALLAEDSYGFHPGKDEPLRIHIEAIGPNLLVVQNGEIVFTVRDSTLQAGGAGVRALTPELEFKDFGLSDLRAGAPVAFRFDFTTSLFTNFYHQMHSSQDRLWRVTLDQTSNAGDLAAKAVSPSQPVSDLETRAYSELASLVLSNASLQDPPQVEATSVEIGGELLGWLVRSPEPIDWQRTEIIASVAAHAVGSGIEPREVKITEVNFGDSESVTVLARKQADFSRHVIQYLQMPTALAPKKVQPLFHGEFSTTTTTDWQTSLDGTGLKLKSIGDSAWNDVILRARLCRITPGTTGVLLRYQNAGNYCRMLFSDSDWRIERVVNGATVLLWKAAAPPPVGRLFEITACLEGSALSFFLDSVLACELTDSTFSSGSFGLCASLGAGLQVSQLEIYPPTLAFSGWDFRDDFNGISPEGWRFVDEGDRNGPSQWQLTDGRLVQASAIEDSNSDSLLRKGTLALMERWKSSDFRLVVRLRSNGGGAIGVVFGYQDQGNYYRFSVATNPGNRRLLSSINGELKVLWEDSAICEVGRDYVFTLDVIDECITGWLNGEQLFNIRISNKIEGFLGLYCCGDPGASFGDFRIGKPSWITYYTFGRESPVPAGNRIQIASALDSTSPNARTSVRYAADPDDPAINHFPLNGTQLRIVAPDGSVQHRKEWISSALYEPVAVRILRKADGTGVFLMPNSPVSASQMLKLSCRYRRNNRMLDQGSIRFTEAGEDGDEWVFIDLAPG